MEEEGWRRDEVQCMRATKAVLVREGLEAAAISDMELAICCMLCKPRPESAATKYRRWLDTLKTFGLASFDEAWGEVKHSADWSVVQSLEFASAPRSSSDWHKSTRWNSAAHVNNVPPMAFDEWSRFVPLVLASKSFREMDCKA